MRDTFIGLAVAACAILGLAGCGAGTTTTDTSQATTAPTAPPTAVPTPKTLATFSGTGIKTTPDFTVPDEWVINWTYDCSKGGLGNGKGNFAITEFNADGSPSGTYVDANELGKGASGTNNQHADAGSKYLSINSECSWTVTVVG